MVFCVKCGFKITEDPSKLCPKCGTDVFQNSKTDSKVNSVSPNATNTSSKKGTTLHQAKNVIGIIIFVSIVLFIGIETDWFVDFEQLKKSNNTNVEPVFFIGTYDDLLRNESNHLGKIVKIEGCVFTSDNFSDLYQITMWDTCSGLDANKHHILSQYPERLLQGDLIQGYGTYFGICTENRIGDPYTCFKNVKLLGYDFETFPKNGVCAVNDKIAEKLGFCE